MPKVSVIIPVYNTERYLPACLDSVLNQSLCDLEAICVDDSSPDRCGEILDEYSARDSRVTAIHLQENRLQGFCRNLGVNQASGKYLYFLDSDDMIEPETLKELAWLADQENLDVVFFDGKATFENEELKKAHPPFLCIRKGFYRDDVYVGKKLLNEFVRQNEWVCYPQRTFWRKEFIQKEGIRFLEGCIHEDEFFAFAGILAAKRAKYVRRQYFTLRVRPNSTMTSPKSPKNFHGYLMNFYNMNEFIINRGVNEDGAQIVAANIYDCAICQYETLKDKFDLGKYFVKEPDKTAYRNFMNYIWLEYGEYGLYAMDAETLKEISKYRIAYVYGIGLTALRVCKKLERHGVLIGGFLTKDAKDAPAILMGRNVNELEKASLPNDAVVVVATRLVSWEETRDMLEKRGVRCIFHKKI